MRVLWWTDPIGYYPGEAHHYEVNQTIHSYRDEELHPEFSIFSIVNSLFSNGKLLSILFLLSKFSISLWKSLTTTPLLVLWGVPSSCTCLDVLCTEFRSGKLDMRACGKVSMLPSTLVLKCGIFLSYLSSSLSSLSSFLSPFLVFSFLALPCF